MGFVYTYLLFKGMFFFSFMVGLGLLDLLPDAGFRTGLGLGILSSPPALVLAFILERLEKKQEAERNANSLQ